MGGDLSRVTLDLVAEMGLGPCLLLTGIPAFCLPTRVPSGAALLPGVGEQEGEDTAEQGDLLAGVFREKEQAGLCFSGEGPLVLAQP